MLYLQLGFNLNSYFEVGGNVVRDSILKRAFAFTMSLCLLIPTVSSLEAFADTNVRVNAGSSGEMGVGNDPDYAHRFMAYPCNQGYRVSIVDANGDRVANSVDIVNYYPRDIENLKDSVLCRRTPASELSNGFKQYEGIVGWGKAEDGLHKKTEFYYTSNIKTEEFTWDDDIGRGIDAGVPDYPGKYGTIHTRMYSVEELKIFWLERLIKYEQDHGLPFGTASLPVNFPLPSNLISEKFSPGGETLKNIFEKKIDDNTNYAKTFLNIVAPLYDNKGYPTGESGHIFTFVIPEVQAKIGTTTASGEEYNVNDALGEYGYKLIIEPLYWFVPEFNSSQFNITGKGLKLHCMNLDGVYYGTVSYLSKLAYESIYFYVLETGNYTKNCFEFMALGPEWGTASLGVTTMQADHDDEGLKIHSIKSDGYGIEKAHGLSTLYSLESLAAGDNYRTKGYGLFIFDSSFFGDQEPATSTFDEKNYATGNPNNGVYTKGPAPKEETKKAFEELKKYIEYLK